LTIWAVVPMKPLQGAKSRLAEVLSTEERVVLSTSLLVRTLEELNRASSISHTLVVSKDSDVLALARSLGARTLMEHGASNLNPALNRATAVAKGYGASGVLVIPADLPNITAADIEAVLSSACAPPVIVIAPDRHQRGTNALLSVPPDLIEYEFGPGSFEKHLHRAALEDIRVIVVDLPALAFDLDWPEDLLLFQEGNSSQISKP
jgi:2-phospho-L-lactate guanylyltransferase